MKNSETRGAYGSVAMLYADENYQKVWREKTDFYNQMKEDQYKELEEYGYLKSYGAAEPEQN